jgi:chromosome segregation ATPase
MASLTLGTGLSDQGFGSRACTTSNDTAYDELKFESLVCDLQSELNASRRKYNGLKVDGMRRQKQLTQAQEQLAQVQEQLAQALSREATSLRDSVMTDSGVHASHEAEVYDARTQVVKLEEELTRMRVADEDNASVQRQYDSRFKQMSSRIEQLEATLREHRIPVPEEAPVEPVSQNIVASAAPPSAVLPPSPSSMAAPAQAAPAKEVRWGGVISIFHNTTLCQHTSSI